MVRVAVITVAAFIISMVPLLGDVGRLGIVVPSVFCLATTSCGAPRRGVPLAFLSFFVRKDLWCFGRSAICSLFFRFPILSSLLNHRLLVFSFLRLVLLFFMVLG